jgi:hypothetical protein
MNNTRTVIRRRSGGLTIGWRKNECSYCLCKYVPIKLASCCRYGLTARVKFWVVFLIRRNNNILGSCFVGITSGRISLECIMHHHIILIFIIDIIIPCPYVFLCIEYGLDYWRNIEAVHCTACTSSIVVWLIVCSHLLVPSNKHNIVTITGGT